MPGALRALQALDVDPRGHDLRGISYRDAHRHADHLFTSGLGRGCDGPRCTPRSPSGRPRWVP
ncbi:hypothetical protein NKG05_13370 [Oerskovia sp. M15]